MAKRRYGIVLEEDVYRSWRTEAVGVGMSIGQWLTGQINPRPESPGEQVAMPGGWAGIHPDLKHMDETRERMNKETSVDEPVKKAIEPEQVKVGNDGKLSKGLGDMPGRMTPKEMQAQKDLILRKISKGKQ